MARLLEETLVVKFSRIVRSDDKQTPVITEELRAQFTELMDELFKDDKSLIVELTEKPREVYRGAEPESGSSESPQGTVRRGRSARGTAETNTEQETTPTA